MKRIFALVVLGLLVSSAAVAQKTNIDWDRQANFSQYHTYMWQKSPHPAKGFWDQRIMDAVDKQLQAKGLTKVDSNPDLWVVYSNSIHEQKEVVGTGYNYGPYWGWGGWGGRRTTDLQHLGDQAGNVGGRDLGCQAEGIAVARFGDRHHHGQFQQEHQEPRQGGGQTVQGLSAELENQVV